MISSENTCLFPASVPNGREIRCHLFDDFSRISEERTTSDCSSVEVSRRHVNFLHYTYCVYLRGTYDLRLFVSGSVTKTCELPALLPTVCISEGRTTSDCSSMEVSRRHVNFLHYTYSEKVTTAVDFVCRGLSHCHTSASTTSPTSINPLPSLPSCPPLHPPSSSLPDL